MYPDSIQTLSMEEVEFSVLPSKKKKANKRKYFLIGGLALCFILFGGLVIGLLLAAKRTPAVETVPSIPTIVEVEQNAEAKKKSKRQMAKPELSRQEVIQKAAPEKQSSIRPVFGLTYAERQQKETSIVKEEVIETDVIPNTIAEARQEKRSNYASKNAQYKNSQKRKKVESTKPPKKATVVQVRDEKVTSQSINDAPTDVSTKTPLVGFNFSVAQTSLQDRAGKFDKGFIKAKLNERITLKGNKAQKVSLRLSETATINGTTFSAGSLCYGRAYLQKEKIQIYVYSIIDSKQGNKLDNTELVVCGSDRNEGIFVGKPTLEGNEIGQALGSMIADATPGRLGDRTVRRTLRQAKIGSGRTLEKGRLVLIRL